MRPPQIFLFCALSSTSAPLLRLCLARGVVLFRLLLRRPWQAILSISVRRIELLRLPTIPTWEYSRLSDGARSAEGRGS